jgi:hypothetical protein
MYHLETGQFSNGLVLGCPVPAKIDHSTTKLVWYSDGHCLQVGSKKMFQNIPISRIFIVEYSRHPKPGPIRVSNGHF